MQDFIKSYVRFSGRCYKAVVVITIALLLLAGAVASRLTIDSRLDGIIPADRPSVVAYRQIDEEFGGNDKVFIIVKSQGSNGAAYVEALAVRLEEDNLAQGLFYKVDASLAERYGPLFLPTELYVELENSLHDPAKALQLVVTNLNQLQEVGIKSGYLHTGDLYVMMLRPGAVVLDPVGRDVYFKGLQRAIDETLFSSPIYAGIEAGYTGGQMVLDYQSDMVAFDGFMSTAVLTFVIIIGIVIASFRRLGVPLATGLPLILGTVITCAFTVLVYGSINIFSMAFAVLLLGLGIDFAILMLTRYSEERSKGSNVEEALIVTLKHSGVGMFTGALTTAVAFGMFAFGEFTALKQMGVISATGIMIALFSMLAVMPAIISWADGKSESKPFRNIEYAFFAPMTKGLLKRRALVLGTMILVSALLFSTVADTKINPDFRSLFPSNIPAAHWLDVMQQEFDYDPDALSLVVSNMEELIWLRQKLKVLPSVKQVECVLDYIPEDQEYKLAVLQLFGAILDTPAVSGVLVNAQPELLTQLGNLSQGLGAMRPLTADELPEAMTSNFVGKNGKYLLEVTVQGDIWDETVREDFSRDLVNIYTDLPAGMPYLFGDIISLIKADVLRISVLAGVAIFMLMLLAFKSYKEALLAMLPAVGAVYLILGLQKILNYNINMFSLMILPLIIGIGVDNGVHLLHRARREQLDELPNILVHLGKSVTTTTLTTIVGFGSLSFVNHPGLVSIGRTVAIGMGLCLMLTVIVLPTLIPWVVRPTKSSINAGADG